jgi:hypothetical protein
MKHAVCLEAEDSGIYLLIWYWKCSETVVCQDREIAFTLSILLWAVRMSASQSMKVKYLTKQLRGNAAFLSEASWSSRRKAASGSCCWASKRRNSFFAASLEARAISRVAYIVCMCMFMYVCIYVYIYTYTLVYECTYVCMYVCMYIYIYIYTHTHMHGLLKWQSGYFNVCMCVYVYTIKKDYARGNFLLNEEIFC